MDAIQKIETGIKPLARIAAVAGVFAGLGILYWFFMDNIYKPSVAVTNADYDKGIADVEYNDLLGRKHTKRIYSGSNFSTGGHWSVRFAGPDEEDYNRIELVKNDITHKVLNLSSVA